jgi:uncharacterized protein (TIGR00297 family)
VLSPSALWALGGVGALAGAAADTWATEIGTAVGGVPRTILGWRPVPAGTSGAVTVAGSVAMVAGACFIGTVAWLAGFDMRVAAAVSVGGIGGATADTILGATLQERRWCARCQVVTERRVHDCGRDTSRRGGWAGMDNDIVNLTSCVAGAVVALLCGSWR